MQLRLAQIEESIKPDAQRSDETIPFPGSLPCPWKPHATFDPASKSFDSIAHAEDALDHVERKMMNIRKLLGMDENIGDGRAA
ncbi:MAG TPA: hypothetical protein VK157_08575 [Phycisphaerales bacterium]|nr:hypothetical protein [Phycisphaerales bacterium]